MKEKIREVVRALVLEKLSIWNIHTDWNELIDRYTKMITDIIEEK